MRSDEKSGIYGSIIVLASAAGFATLPFFALSAYGKGITVSTLLCLRFAIAAIMLFVLGGRSGGVLPGELQKGVLRLLITLGVLFALDASLYLRAVKHIPAAMASLLLYAYPALVTVLSWAVDRHKPGVFSWIAVGLSTAGLVLFIGTSQVKADAVGIALGVSAALTYASYIVLSARVVDKVSSTIATAYVCAVASLGLLAFGLAMGDIDFAFPGSGWFPIVGMTLTSSIMGMFGFMKGVHLIGPTKASIISTIEPVITAVMAFFLYGQGMGTLQVLGGSAVLAGCIIVSLGDAGKPAEPVTTEC